jgi:hypothetical protein
LVEEVIEKNWSQKDIDPTAVATVVMLRLHPHEKVHDADYQHQRVRQLAEHCLINRAPAAG